MHLTKLICIFGNNSILTRALINNLVNDNVKIVLVEFNPSLHTRNNITNYNYKVIVENFFSKSHKQYLQQADFIIDLTFVADINSFNNLYKKFKIIKNVSNFLAQHNPNVVYNFVSPLLKEVKIPFFFKKLVTLEQTLSKKFAKTYINTKTSLVLDNSNYINNLQLVVLLNNYYNISFILATTLANILSTITINYSNYINKKIHLGNTDNFNIKDGIVIFKKYKIMVSNNHTEPFLLLKIINKFLNSFKLFYYKILLNQVSLISNNAIGLNNFNIEKQSTKASLMQCNIEYMNGFK